MENFAQAATIDSVACPFCGLLCDDLTVNRSATGDIDVSRNGCQKSVTFFKHPVQNPTPRIAGNPATLQEAIAQAADILAKAKHPLISGLGTEVQGMRAAMSLADKACAAVDHMNSRAFMRNIQVVQNSGWQITTLTEVKNRVDLLVVLGTDIVSDFPRFFEREVWNTQSMFDQDTSSREIVYLGGRNIDTAPGISPTGRQPQVIPCDKDRIPEVVAALRALVGGKRPAAAEVAGIAMDTLAALADQLKAAQYSVIAWQASKLDFPHAELAIQHVTEMIKSLNLTTRASGLPLGGMEGDVSANQVSAWISGYPMRSTYARGFPEHDPYHLSTEQMIDGGEADALCWISTFNPERLPPRNSLPTIVIGHPSMTFEEEPAVFIPVGTPGVDHNGIMFRSDSVVSIPLDKLRDSPLPTLSQVLTAIEQAL